MAIHMQMVPIGIYRRIAANKFAANANANGTW